MAQVDPRIEAFLNKQSQTPDSRIDSFLSKQNKEEMPTEAAPEILNEYADIPLLQRGAVKNLGVSIGDQVDYLKNKNPGLDIKEYDGEIIAKRPEEKAYKRLDPGGLANLDPREMFRDVLDVGTDVASGVLSTVAGTAAAIPTAAATGGAGAIPAAMAASGATSAGLEAIRQGLGKWVGTTKGINTGDIATSGVLGALGPALFGTGATAAQIAKGAESPSVIRNLLEKSKIEYIKPGAEITPVQKQLAQEVLGESQKGYFSDLPKKILGGVSGVPQSATKEATDQVDKSLVNKLVDVGGLKVNKDRPYTNLELADWMETSGVDAVGKTGRNEIGKVKEVLVLEGKKIENALVTAGQEGKKIDISKHRQPLIDLTSTYDQMLDESDIPAIREQRDNVLAVIEKYFPKDGNNEVSPMTAFKLKQELADKIDFNRTPVQVSTALERAITQSERGLSDEIYDKIDGKQFKEAYRKHSDILENIYKYFKDEDTAVNTLKNPETLRKPTVKKQLENFDIEYKTSLGDLSKLAQTWKYFGRPPTQPIVGGGSGQFWRGAGMGGALGTMAAQSLGIPAFIGGAAGGLAGGALTSPAAIKIGLKAETAATRGIKALTDRFGGQKAQEILLNLRNKMPEVTQSAITPQAGYQSAWQMMKGR
jgi:hypothetical protein